MNNSAASRTYGQDQVDARRRTEKFINRFTMSSLAGLLVVQFGAIWIYCAFLPSNTWPAFASAVMVSAASLLLGNLAGFLFGIPRALTSATDGNSRSQPYLDNTNLEQVSDWLTKIIVGVSLVEFENIINGTRDLARTVAPIFGDSSPQNQIMAGATIIYSVVFGFLAAYVAARTIITVLLYSVPSRIPADEEGEGAGHGGGVSR